MKTGCLMLFRVVIVAYSDNRKSAQTHFVVQMWSFLKQVVHIVTTVLLRYLRGYVDCIIKLRHSTVMHSNCLLFHNLQQQGARRTIR